MFEKNYRRFVDEAKKKFGQMPSTDATKAWIELFISQQVIIACAEAQGYNEKPEVCSAVERMERYMLTQPAGPFYKTLSIGNENTTDEKSREIREKRRLRFLANAKFSLNPLVAAKIVEQVQGLSMGESEILADKLGFNTADEFFHYTLESHMTVVSIASFCSHFNKLLVRQMPDTINLVDRAAEDMALEEFDFRGAIAQGIDRQPQFEEDRRSFRMLSVLEFYEIEMLRPALGLEPNAVENYYHEHLSAFTGAIKVSGRVLSFARPGQRVPTSEIVSELSASAALNELDGLKGLIFQGPPGIPLGPIRRKTDFVIFIKVKDLEMGTLPLGIVAPVIRATLLRQRLDRYELSLAKELCGRLKVEDHLDLSSYELSGMRVALPWVQ